MPQNSAIYAVSRIRSRERSLIDRETVKRMSEGTAEEAWRMLTEMATAPSGRRIYGQRGAYRKRA